MVDSVFFYLQKKQFQQSTNENAKGNMELPQGIVIM